MNTLPRNVLRDTGLILLLVGVARAQALRLGAVVLIALGLHQLSLRR
jgi:hypothetical protein